MSFSSFHFLFSGWHPWGPPVHGSVNRISPRSTLTPGLDERFGWAGSIPFWVQIAAFLLLGLSYPLFTRAMASNKFSPPSSVSKKTAATPFKPADHIALTAIRVMPARWSRN